MQPRRFFLVSIVVFVLLTPVWAQTETEPDTAPDAPRSLFESTILSDLSTATPAEILDWARALGLSTRGSRREVEDRILDSYGLDRAALSAGRVPPSPGTRDGEAPDGEERSLLRIERGRGSEFFTLEETGEEYLRLSGGVSLTLEEGDTVHRIEAQRIVLNLTENSMTAHGGVRYTTERPDGTEEFRGETIVFQIDTWAGVFIHGITETKDSAEADDVEFSVEGERITRSPEEIIVVDGGTITSSQADPPNYRIRAERIWILAPGEWGLRNAVLYVGRVPTFFLPVFFLPGDRLFFHPAVGTRTRDGAFIQTTTYFIGESEERDPPISIMRLAESPDESDRVIRGLFLRVPDDPVVPDPPGWSLKLMLDTYSTLGAYAGVAATMPDLGPLEVFDWRVGLAASRNVYLRNGTYTPWYIDDDGTARQHWNSGWVLGNRVPFRYETEVDASLRIASLSLGLDLLLLSDPEFRRDFGVRSEAMDWGFVLNSGQEEEPETGATVASSTWESTLSWSPSLPTALSPWVSSFSVSRLGTRLDWRSRTASELPDAVTRSDSDASPEASFWYPETLVVPDLALSVRGTLVDLPRGSVNDNDEEESEDESEDEEDTLDLRPPWETSEEEDLEEEERFRLPDRAGNADGIATVTDGTFRIGYSLQPSLRYDRITDNKDWDSGDDVDLSWRYSTLQSRTQAQLTTTAEDSREFVSLSSSLSAEHRYQDVDVTDVVTTVERENLRERAFRYRGFSSNQRTTLTTYPLRSVPTVDSSSVQYRLNTLVYTREFQDIGSDGVPEYRNRWVQWREEDVSAHQTQVRFVWDLWGANQRLTATSDLPPRDRSYLGSVNLTTGPFTHGLSGGYRETDDDGWEPDTLVQTHGLSLLDNDVSVRQRVEYDMEAVRPILARTSASLWWFDAAVTGRHTEGFRFVPGSGWEAYPTPAFRWTTLTADIDIDYTVRTWKRRITMELNGRVGLDADLQRFTNSAMVVSYGFTLDIYRFLDLEVTARSRNNQIYRYLPGLASDVDVPRRSLITDLIDSVRLFDRTAREEALFKLDTFDVSLVHDLQDWELSLTYSGSPELERGVQPRYRWRSVVSILLRWRPISELQRSIEIDDGEVEFGT